MDGFREEAGKGQYMLAGTPESKSILRKVEQGAIPGPPTTTITYSETMKTVMVGNGCVW